MRLQSFYGPVMRLLLPVLLIWHGLMPIFAADSSLPVQGINLSLRVLLQGPYVDTTGLMHDRLSQSGFIPLSQPFAEAPWNYGGTEQLLPASMGMSGQDSLVDWVLLELRAVQSPRTVAARRAAILQRDGDVVEPATANVGINFPTLTAGDYYVGIRHRNHLAVFTANAVSLSQAGALVDFSSAATAVRGKDVRIASGGFRLLPGGDANRDNNLIAVGSGNDSNLLLASVLTADGNGGHNSSYRLSGYVAGDFNLDGTALFAGPGNDLALLLQNVLTNVSNINFAMNYIVSGNPDF